MKNLSIHILALCFFSQLCFSANFCVTNGSELQSAFIIAKSNLESDSIKLTEGTFDAPSAGFYFLSYENFDLEISGGWSEFFGSPCGLQTINPYNTELDGGGIDASNFYGVLTIITGAGVTTADITIENILFINGYIDNNSSHVNGGGLEITTDTNHTGHVVIERNVFLHNTSQYSSAVYATAGKLTFKNNLVVDNHSEYSESVTLISDNKTGIYVTNNTIHSNSTNSVNHGGLTFRVTGSSQAMLANNIFYDNDTHDLQLDGDGYIYLYKNNIVKPYTGVMADEEWMNFSSVPIFESGILNYTPALNSDLINSGYIPLFLPPNPFYRNWSLSSTDLAGNNRVEDDFVDVGAYETPKETPIFMNGFE